MSNMRQKLSERLVTSGLKVTPQRIAVLEAICSLDNHPTAEQITHFVREHYPHIAAATIYKTLDAFLERNLVRKVETGRDVMRYDATMESHHHLYAQATDQIENYFDSDLDELLNEYFRNKKIPGFSLQEIRVQVFGNFNQ